VGHPGEFIVLVLRIDEARADPKSLLFLVNHLNFTGGNGGNWDWGAEHDVTDRSSFRGMDKGIDEDGSGGNLRSVKRMAEWVGFASLVKDRPPHRCVIDSGNLRLCTEKNVLVDVVALRDGCLWSTHADIMPESLVLPGGQWEAGDPGLADEFPKVDDRAIGVQTSQSSVDSLPGRVVAADGGNDDRLVFANVHEGFVDRVRDQRVGGDLQEDLVTVLCGSLDSGGEPDRAEQVVDPIFTVAEFISASVEVRGGV
jgi:hypothetical protein